MYIEFKAVKRKTQLSFVTPVTEEDIKEFKKSGKITAKNFDHFEVSISESDRIFSQSPKIGDMIALNPKNHVDQWLIEEEYFKDNHITNEEVTDIQPIKFEL